MYSVEQADEPLLLLDHLEQRAQRGERHARRARDGSTAATRRPRRTACAARACPSSERLARSQRARHQGVVERSAPRAAARAASSRTSPSGSPCELAVHVVRGPAQVVGIERLADVDHLLRHVAAAVTTTTSTLVSASGTNSICSKPSARRGPARAAKPTWCDSADSTCDTCVSSVVRQRGVAGCAAQAGLRRRAPARAGGSRAAGPRRSDSRGRWGRGLPRCAADCTNPCSSSADRTFRTVADDTPSGASRAITTEATGSPVSMYSRTTVARMRLDLELRVLVSISSRTG